MKSKALKNTLKTFVSALLVSATLLSASTQAAADRLGYKDELLYRCSDSGEVKSLMTGWVRKGEDRYYYKNGVMLKSRWLSVGGKKTYYLLRSGKTAVGSVTIGGRQYTFDSSGKLLDTSERVSVKTTGTAPSQEDIRTLIEREKRIIGAYVLTETKGVSGDISIAVSGYNYLQINDNSVALDSVTLPVFSGDRIIGEVLLFSYDGELHYSVLAGGTRWDTLNVIWSENPGKKMAFLYIGQFIELAVSPDNKIYDMRGEGEGLDKYDITYRKYAIGSNTYSLSDIIKDKKYVSVSPSEYTSVISLR